VSNGKPKVKVISSVHAPLSQMESGWIFACHSFSTSHYHVKTENILSTGS